MDQAFLLVILSKLQHQRRLLPDELRAIVFIRTVVQSGGGRTTRSDPMCRLHWLWFNQKQTHNNSPGPIEFKLDLASPIGTRVFKWRDFHWYEI